METVIYIYFATNIFIAGMYYGDVSFNLYSRYEIGGSLFKLLLFGVIILAWQCFFETRFNKFFTGTLLGFYFNMYILRKYDNLCKEQLNFIIGQISAEKELKTTEKQSVKLIKHLTKILKRNGS